MFLPRSSPAQQPGAEGAVLAAARYREQLKLRQVREGLEAASGKLAVHGGDELRFKGLYV